MGKKTPKAPTPPDPNVVAAAQTGMNIDTAVANANLNRINQYTPEGALEFNQIGTNADGTPKYESRQTYSPEQQAIYDTQNKVSQSLSGLALENVKRVNDVQSKPFNYDNMTPLQTNVNREPISYGYDPGGDIYGSYDTAGQQQRTYQGGGDIQRAIGGAGNIADTYGSGGDITRGYDMGGDVTGTYGSGGDIQKQLDYSKLAGLPGIGDFGAEAQRASDAVYQQATSRLDPRFEQEQRQMASSLAAKGVSENSEAYRRAMDQFTRQKTDAYNQATYSGVQAGGQEQSRLFGLAMGARQQGQSEADAMGQFANSAQAQGESQAAARAGFANTAQGQRNAQNAAAAGFANTAQGQAEQQARERAGFGNEAQQQRFGQEQAKGEFANTAQGQANEQSKQAAEFGNAAQEAQYAQNQSGAAFNNQAQQQLYAQNAAAAAFGNMAQGQQYNQDSAQAAFNNNARQQQIQEATYLRNLPLNEISALMGTAGGVAQPNFADFANVNVANTDYAGLVQNQFNNQNQLYQQAQAQKNAMMGQIFGLVGGVGGAAMSDRRLKTGIKAVGQLANGIKTYVFSYIGSKAREFGVMADEVFKVRPSAVLIRSDGYLMVDYGKVW